jgi:hypothetical protein
MRAESYKMASVGLLGSPRLGAFADNFFAPFVRSERKFWTRAEFACGPEGNRASP